MNSYHNNLLENYSKTKLVSAPPTHRVWTACNLAHPKKSKKLIEQTPIIIIRQKITQKIKVGPRSTHPPSLSPCELPFARSPSQKIKETHAANSNNNNSPKNYSKNLSWTKLHPPIQFEPHASYRLQEANPQKIKEIMLQTPIITTRQKITQKI